MAASYQFRRAVRWGARLTGAGSTGLLLLFVLAHVFEDTPGPGPTSSEWLGLTFFPVGVLLGLAAAFFRARLGALIALGSLTAFYLWHFVDSGRFPSGPYFLLFTSPAILFLMSAALDNAGTSPNTTVPSKHHEPGPSESTP